MTSIARPSQYLLLTSAENEVGWLVAHLDARGHERARVDEGFWGPQAVDTVSAISRVAFVVAFVGPPRTNASMFAEIGIALGARRPMLIIVTDESESLPAALAGVASVRWRRSDSKEFLTALDRFLESAFRPKRPAPRRTRALGPRSQELLARLSTTSPTHLEDLLRAAFLEAGSLVEEGGSQEGLRPDFAVWVDDLGSRRNPVLVEAKSSLGSPPAFIRTAEQVTRYAERSRSSWCLVVYASGPLHAPRVPTVSPKVTVAFVRVDDFLMRLVEDTLGQTLKTLFSAKSQ